MRSIIIPAILAATAALTTACGTTDSVAPTLAPATARYAASRATGASPISRTIDQYVSFSCGNGGAGETIHVTGELRYDVQSTKDSSGVYHFSIKSNTFGVTGVGLTSGEFFRGSMAEHLTSRAEDNLNMDVRTTDMIRFVAPGSGDAFSLMVTSHFIVDQGDYVLWDQTWDEVCR